MNAVLTIRAVNLGAREGSEYRFPPSVTDEALLAVQQPGAIALPDCARLDVEDVGASMRLRERERR
jgi:hypothetical protein